MYINLFSFLLIVALVWWLTYQFFYSPKARIKRLWEEVFKISFRIGEQTKKGESPIPEDVNAVNKKKRLINALLDYYFNPENEEDKEYIEQNKA